MALLSASFFFDVLAVFTALVVILIAYCQWKFTYWDRKGIPVPIRPRFPFGNIVGLLAANKSVGEQFGELYNSAKSKGLKHFGTYQLTTPTYVPIDPELVKSILQTDFDHFMNHGIFVNEEVDPLQGHLFNLNDAKWRNMRVKLTPTFTSGKMKMMFQRLADCGDLLKKLVDQSADSGEPADIKEMLACFSTDIIASCAFGLDSNSLSDPDSEFRKYGRKIFQLAFFGRLRRAIMQTLPHGLLRALKMKVTNPEVENFFMNIVKQTVEHREKNQVYRKDVMHLLIQLKNLGRVTEDETLITKDGAKEEALTMNELAAQAFVFFIAGFETSATTMTWALYELAHNTEVQSKLRNEINSVLQKHDGKLTYDAVLEMTYLDKVVKETLRKYPALAILLRICNKDFVIPGTSITIKKGTPVRIPAMGLQMDPEYYPEPEKFDPERFSEEAKNKRHPFTWLPFGEGPRHCIGLRFGMMQSKVGVITLVKNFRIKLNEKTKYPVGFEPRAFFPVAKGGVWLDIEKI